MRIIIDTREQKSLVFNHKQIKSVERFCLSVGDYACIVDGCQLPIHFERKSIPDLYGTLSAGYERFKKEIFRAKSENIQLIIIIEGTLTKVLKGARYSMRTPESLVYQLFTISTRYNIPIVFCKDPEEVAEYITQFFISHKNEYLDKLRGANVSKQSDTGLSQKENDSRV